MTAVFEQVAASRQTRRTEAMTEYRQIMHRIFADQATADDAERLDEVMTLIGVTPAESEADLLAMKSAAKVRAELLTEAQCRKLNTDVATAEAAHAKLIHECIANIVAKYAKDRQTLWQLHRAICVALSQGMLSAMSTEEAAAYHANEDAARITALRADNERTTAVNQDKENQATLARLRKDYARVLE